MNKKFIKLFSESLKCEIVLDGHLTQESNEEEFAISHKSLDRLFNKLKKDGVLSIPEYDYKVLSPTHSFVICEIKNNETGEVFKKSGESTLGSLTNERASMSPGKMAEKRAFDEAFISFLDIPVEKYFSILDEPSVVLQDFPASTSSTKTATYKETPKTPAKEEPKKEEPAKEEPKKEEPKKEEPKKEEPKKEEPKKEEPKKEEPVKEEPKKEETPQVELPAASDSSEDEKLFNELGNMTIVSLTSISTIKDKKISDVFLQNAKFIEYVLADKIAAKSPEQVKEKDSIIKYAELKKKLNR